MPIDQDKYHGHNEECSGCGLNINRCERCRLFYNKGQVVNCTEDGHFCNNCASGIGYVVDRVDIAKQLNLYLVRNENVPVAELLYRLWWHAQYKEVKAEKMYGTNDLDLFCKLKEVNK